MRVRSCELLQIHDYTFRICSFIFENKFNIHFRQYKILTVDEFRTLMTGAFMAKYIRLYREEYLRWKTGHLEVSPIDENISRNVRFFSKLILSLMDSLSKILSQHFVRGHRFLLRLLRDKVRLIIHIS